MDCFSCFESLGNADWPNVRLDCGHLAHYECMGENLATMLQENVHLVKDIHFRCPVAMCSKIISDTSAIKLCTDKAMREKYKKLAKEREHRALTNVKGYKKCPTPECQGFFIIKGESFMTCKHCDKNICLNCEVPMHKGSCANY